MALTLVYGVPCAQVGPSKVTLHHIHVAAVLQYAIVDRQVGVDIIVFANKLNHILCRIVEVYAREHCDGIGEQLSETFPECPDVAEHHTSVPVELTAVHKHLGKLALWFLCKRLHLVYLAVAVLCAQLYVSVARLRSCWRHTHHQHYVVGGYGVKRIAHIAYECLLIEHQLV